MWIHSWMGWNGAMMIIYVGRICSGRILSGCLEVQALHAQSEAHDAHIWTETRIWDERGIRHWRMPRTPVERGIRRWRMPRSIGVRGIRRWRMPRSILIVASANCGCHVQLVCVASANGGCHAHLKNQSLSMSCIPDCREQSDSCFCLLIFTGILSWWTHWKR